MNLYRLSVLPYIELSEWVLLPAGSLGDDSAPLSLKPFEFLVATGVYLGARVALGYGTRRGLSGRALASFIYWVVLAGFIGGHVFDVLLYSPERLRDDPWALVRIWDGLSSFGGFAGATIGALSWRYRHKTAILPYAEAVCAGLPLGWVFGRAGCAVVHDHPGIRSASWLAVNFPGGSRFDLGLLEMALTVPIAVVFLLLMRRAWLWGIFVATLSLVYAPLRFGLDFLRIREAEAIGSDWLLPDARYAGLTPAQWACLLLALFGAQLLRRTLKSHDSPLAFEAPPAPAAFAVRPAPNSDS